MGTYLNKSSSPVCRSETVTESSSASIGGKMDRFELLLKWLQGDKENGIPSAEITEKLTVIDDPTMGRCIVASDTIGKHQSITTIPHTYMLNFVTVLLHLHKWNRKIDLEDLRYGHVYVPDYSGDDDDEISRVYRKLDPQRVTQLSSFQLISFYLVMESQRSTKSFWKPFIDVLPEVEELSGIPFIWIFNDPENSPFTLLPEKVKSHSLKQLTKFNDDYNTVIELISGLTKNPEGLVTREKFLWAWICCNSRCLYMNLPKKLNKTVDDNFTLVPYVDFLNHQIDDHCGIEISSQKGFQVNTNDSKYKKGDQIYFSYGAHDDDFLLCEYGFMFEPGFNHWNYIDITDWLIKLMKPAHVTFLQNEGYYEEYTLTKDDISFRTEVALATIQESELRFTNDGCPARLRDFLDGISDGTQYKKGSEVLIKKIVSKIAQKSQTVLDSLEKASQVENKTDSRFNLVKNSHLNILQVSKSYL